MFVAYSCKQRCTCPSCQQKRALLTALHVAEEGCCPVAHQQVVFTIPNGCDCTPASTASSRASSAAALGHASRSNSAACTVGRTWCRACSGPSRRTANCCIGIRTSTRWSPVGRLPPRGSSWKCRSSARIGCARPGRKRCLPSTRPRGRSSRKWSRTCGAGRTAASAWISRCCWPRAIARASRALRST